MRFLAIYALADVGGVIAYLPLLTILLPLRVQAVAGDARLGLLTAAVTAGALAASTSNVLFGWLSDRAMLRGCGRRRGVAGGLVLMTFGCALPALATTPTELIGAVAGFQVGVNALLAPLLAIMADEIPDQQKGFAGGLLALGIPVASAWSVAIVGAGACGTAVQFALVPLASVGCVMPLLTTRAVAISSGAAVAESVGGRRDLALVWAARLLVQVAGNVLSLYALYYFESVAAAAPPTALAGQVGHVLTLAYLVALPLAIAAGRLSDRTGQRKTYLLGAAGVTALGLALMILATDVRGAALAFGVYAVGAATFLALHSGFAMQLLPSPERRGRDLGLLNLSNTLPALAGPLLAWRLATPHDFDALLGVLALLTLAGGLLILPAKGRQ